MHKLYTIFHLLLESPGSPQSLYLLKTVQAQTYTFLTTTTTDSKMQQKDKVVVIGAGALGFMVLKQFKEDAFDVAGYESRPYVGGLWKDSGDNTISVHATTIFNTSKFRAAISGFPFPETARIHDYLCSYADHFDLRRHINVNTRVKQILRENDRWNLTWKM